MTINEESERMLVWWDVGYDTLWIAHLMDLKEWYVYSVLNRAREARRRLTRGGIKE